MKDIIEKCIAWDELGGRDRFSYEIKKAVISKETETLTVDIEADFVVPKSSYRKIVDTIRESVPELAGGVNVNISYKELVQSDEEVFTIYIDYIVDEIRVKYPGLTSTVRPSFELDADTLKVAALGERTVESLNKKIAEYVEGMIKRDLDKDVKVLFVNDRERYERVKSNFKAIDTRLADNPVKHVAVEEKIKGDNNRTVKEQEAVLIYGKKFEPKPRKIADINVEMGSTCIAGTVFKIDERSVRNDLKLVSIYLTDKTNSTCAKAIISKEKWEKLDANLSKGDYIALRGTPEEDRYEHELVVRFRDIVRMER